jgi:hypothetical protein
LIDEVYAVPDVEFSGGYTELILNESTSMDRCSYKMLMLPMRWSQRRSGDTWRSEKTDNICKALERGKGNRISLECRLVGYIDGMDIRT